MRSLLRGHAGLRDNHGGGSGETGELASIE
jgi:hypothetical protein